LLIDNSAWLFPAYLNSFRTVSYRIGGRIIQLYFDYLIKNNGAIDKNIYYLPYLYNTLGTECNLIIYQGINDNLVNYHEKAKLAEIIETSSFHLITKKDIDGRAFGSTGHGLGSDHLQLFSLAYTQNNFKFPSLMDTGLDDVSFKTNLSRCHINYNRGLPIFDCQKL